MPKDRPTKSIVSTAISKYPTWTTLNNGQPVVSVEAPPKVELDIDVNNVARVRVLPGYDANIGELRIVT